MGAMDRLNVAFLAAAVSRAAGRRLAAGGGVAWRLLIGAVIASAMATAQGTPRASAVPPLVHEVEGVREYRLPNGLQVLLAPDDSKPTTTVNLTYRVGSRHEGYGETGMAHLLEHLLFKGTPRHPTVWAEFNKRGLRANGSTWLDRTNYFASFAANDASMDWYLDWLADSMTRSFIAKKDLDSEMTVVRNEWEMGENNPGNILFEKAMSAAYQWHNYGKSTIGARSDVENVDIARLRAFYERYYQPDNATLIVTGRFEARRTLSTIIQRFGAIPKPRRALPRLYTLEPVQDGERQVTLRRTGGTPALLAIYHTVPGAHPDHAAVELLSSVMADVPSGRLHRKLVEVRLAASVWSWTVGLHDPGFVAFGANLAPGQDEAAAVAASLAVLENLEAEPITAAEVDRARLRWLKAWDTQFASAEQLGVALSESVAQGDWRLHFLLRDRIKAVKAEDVQRVATQRLVTANRTLGIYRPTDGPRRAPAPAAVDVAAEMRGFVPQPTAAAVAPFDPSPAHLDARTERGALAPTLPGVRVALLPKATRGEAVNLAIVLHGGDAALMQGQAENLGFIAAMLDKGTRQLGRQQLADRLDELQTQLGVAHLANEPGSFMLRAQTRRAHVPALLALVGQMLREPAFEPAVVEELKRQALADLEAARKEPETILEEALARHETPYRRGDVRHPRSIDERIEDVKAVTPEALRALHAKLFGAGFIELSLVGDFDAATARAAASRAFDGWPTPVAYQRVRFEPRQPAPTRMVLRTPDKANAVFMATLPLPVGERDDDHVPLMLANHLLGGGGNSRLWLRVREKGGLSYDVGSAIQWDVHERNSWWLLNAIYAPANRQAVETAVREEIERTRRDGFTARELAEAKDGLLKLRQLSRAQDGTLALQWTRHLNLGRSFAHAADIDARIQRTTLEQVNAALRRYLDPQHLVWGVAGDFPP